jgi:hypothetical protein
MCRNRLRINRKERAGYKVFTSRNSAREIDISGERGRRIDDLPPSSARWLAWPGLKTPHQQRQSNITPTRTLPVALVLQYAALILMTSPSALSSRAKRNALATLLAALLFETYTRVSILILLGIKCTHKQSTAVLRKNNQVNCTDPV